MIKVKVCGMIDPFNVREIAGTKPDFIGFIFYPGSPRFIGMNPDRALFLNVPPGISRTGVFVNEEKKKILDLIVRYGLDMIQLHGNESPAFCLQLRSAGIIITKAFNLKEISDFEKLKPYMPGCDYFLFDTKSEIPGGSGKQFNWDILTAYSLDKPFFLSGGIGPEDAGLIKNVETRGFYAVDVNSRFETVPGIKNVTQVKTFIYEIKNNQI